MKISVITPTAERARYLQGAYQLLKQQSYTHWEWLVYDTSLHPMSFNDKRVTYIHDDNIVSIGEKRNRLVAQATGDVIVHFDDDDYYAPTYLQYILDRLQQAAFFTVSSWFSYDTKTHQCFYWDTEELGESRYILNAMSGSCLREIELGPWMGNQKDKLNYNGKIGYGFSFAYHKQVLKSCSFPDIDLAEDRHFYERVEAAGFPIDATADQKAMVIHVIHESNTSTEYPQYRLPRFLVESLAPPFFSYLAGFHEN